MNLPICPIRLSSFNGADSKSERHGLFGVAWLLLLLLFFILSTGAEAQTTTGTTADGFKYTTGTNNQVTITGYSGTSVAVNIPVTINALPVTSIGSSAFQYHSSLTSVTIPNSVTGVGDSAFANCNSLVRAVFMGNAPLFGAGVFSYSASSFMVYVFDGATGFTAPSWNGYSAVILGCPSMASGIVTGVVGAPFSQVIAWGYPTSYSASGLPPGLACDTAAGLISGTPSVTGTFNVTVGATNPAGTGTGTLMIVVAQMNYTANNGQITITGCSSDLGGVVGIPGMIDGLPVTGVGSNAFAGCTGLTSVTIPNTVASIGDGAFAGCTGLISAIFAGNAPSMGTGVFDSAASGFTVDYFDSATGFTFTTWNGYPVARFTCATDGIEKTVMAYTGSGGAVRIPDSTPTGLRVTGIGMSAFFGSTSLTSVTIPTGVTSIGRTAFSGCSNLTSVTIPNSVISIASDTFSGYNKLTSIAVDALNTVYSSSADGVLFNKSQTILLRCPGGKSGSYTIPNGVTTVGYNAIASCVGLTRVAIPGSVTSILGSAFAGSNNLAGAFFMGNAPTTMDSTVFSSTGFGFKAYYYNGATGFTSPTWYGFSTVNLSTPSISSWNITGIVGAPLSYQIIASGYPTAYSASGLPPGLALDAATGLISGTPSVTGTFNVTLGASSPAGSATAPVTIMVAQLNYTTNNGQITITGFTGSTGAVNLPAMLDGLPVTGIANGSFAAWTGLTSVTIPATVTSIGDSAFSGCTSLVNAIFMGNAPTMGTDVFDSAASGFTVDYINGSTGFTAPYWNGYTVAKLSYTTSNNQIAITGYSGAGATVSIPDTINGLPVTSISGEAFYCCTNMTSITIPSSVASIGNTSFDSCTSLSTALFMGNAPSIGSTAFYKTASNFKVCYFYAATGFTSPTWNGYKAAYFKYTTGNGQIAITGYGGSSGAVIIPGFVNDLPVTSIGNNAFSGCTGLTSVTIPNSVTSVGSSAFAGCNQLTNVTIPDSVNSIGDSAFSGCTSLAMALFMGNAPSVGTGVFASTASGFAVDYYNGAAGFSTPAWNGYTSVKIGAPAVSSAIVSAVPEMPFNYQIVSSGYPPAYSASGLPTGVTCNTATGLISGTPSLTGTFNATMGASNPAGSGTGSLTVVVLPLLYTTGSSQITITGYTGSGGTLSIPDSINGLPVTTIASSAFKNCTTLTAVSIPNSVTSTGTNVFQGCTGLTSVTLSNSLTSIAAYAFSGCSTLTSVTIPNGVTSTGSNAFAYCSSLASVTIPAGLTSIGNSTFYGCSQLTSLAIPNSVTSIGTSAFNGCSSLVSVTIPGSVASIGAQAFDNCSSLSSIAVDSSNSNFSSSADGVLFNKNQTSIIQYPAGRTDSSYTIPNTVTSTGSYSFDKCTSLTSVTISGSVATIGSYSFDGCTGLTAVTISNSVTSLGSGAFYGCTSLSSMTIPGNVTSLGSNVFYNCTGLTSVTIPASVTSIGTGAFQYCSSLTGVTLPSVTSIGNYTFQGCSSLTSMTIPTSVTSLGTYAFSGCTSLTTVTIPNNVTSIGSGAFYSCTGLTSIMIGSKVATIGNDAFNYCYNLTSVAIPNSVTSIGSNAFYWCTNLSSVTLGNKVASIGNNAFDVCNKLNSVTIPASVTSIGTYGFSSLSNAVFMGNAPSTMGSYALGSPTVYYYNGATGFTSPTWNGYPVVNMGLSTQTGSLKMSISPAEAVSGGAQWQVDGTGTWFASGATASNLSLGLHSVSFSTLDSWITPANQNIPVIASSTAQASGTYTVIFNYTGTNGQVTITGYSGTGGAVNIPSTIPGVSGTVTRIENFAFQDNNSLTSVTIPSSVASIGVGAFSDCSKLTAITVDANNPVYSSDADGVLFNKSQTTLIQYPGGKLGGYTIPSSVTSIGDEAFAQCIHLTSITIPNSVTSIADQAFSGSALTSVTIPSSVTSIGDYAFYLASSLKNAVFMGNAPSLGIFVFDVTPSFTVFFYNNKTGFTSPTWNGYTAVNLGDSSPSVAAWLQANGFSSTTNLQSAPNGDGVSLLMAYALNLDPTRNQSRNIPQPVVAGNTMSLTYYAASHGITYTVQTSTDLKTWSTDGVTLSGPDANNRYTATVPKVGLKCFMRLAVSH